MNTIHAVLACLNLDALRFPRQRKCSHQPHTPERWPSRGGHLLAAVCCFAMAGASAWGAAFTAGNIAVVRLSIVGTSSSSQAVFIDEYKPDGTFVQTITIPASGSPVLTMAGNATSEGALMRSP